MVKEEKGKIWLFMQISDKDLLSQLNKFPSSRYMGSKEKLVPKFYEIFNKLEFESSLDIMSGSCSVSYLLKTMGKKVITNDYMSMNYDFGKAFIENNSIIFPKEKINSLFRKNEKNTFLRETFSEIYYSEKDSSSISNIRNNIEELPNGSEKFIAKAALIRSCIKKRARGIFAYTGFKYDDGRRDLKLSIEEHFENNIEILNNSIFDNGKKNLSLNLDCLSVKMEDVDLVYIDPPYFSKLSDNEYVRRYHFTEGLSKNWSGLSIQKNTKTKKFKSYQSSFNRLDTTIDAFEKLLDFYSDSIIVISYSSNSLPSKSKMIELISKYKNKVSFYSQNHRYSFGNQSIVKNKIRNKKLQ